MKKRLTLKLSALIMAAAVALTLLASCATKGDYEAGYDAPSYNNGSYGSSNDKVEKLPTEDSGANDVGSVPSGGIDNPAAKIIKTANAEMRTTKYDDFLTSLYAKITEFSGYTDGETFSGSGKYRRATVTVRIPAARHEEFKTALSGLGTMSYYSANKQDVTLTYEILKSEVDTLTAEIAVVEELFEIAKQNKDLNEISKIEEKLTDLRLRVAEANARLTVYDNSIAYSTIYLTVYEAEEIVTPEPEPEPTAIERIGSNLKRAFTGIGEFFVDLFVFIVSAIPYLLVIALFASVPVTLITLKIRKKRAKKNEDEE